MTPPPEVAPFHTIALSRRAHEMKAAGRSVIHMEFGQPSTGAPAAAIAEAQRVLAVDGMGYWESAPLRAAIARRYGDLHGLAIDPERILITAGASPALLLALSTLFRPGDRVALARPGYVAYRNVLRALHLVPVEIACGPATRFQLDAAQIASLDPAPAGIIVASPANPTGTIIPAEGLRAIAALCRERGIRIVSDEIYHGLGYDLPTHSMLEFEPRTTVINSFSKYFSMAGWRLGWLVAADDEAARARAYCANFFLTAPSLSQHAGLVAMGCGAELDGHVATYRANRALMMDALPRLGLTDVAPPDGAFYLYADVGHMTGDSFGFCRHLLADTGVGGPPRHGFGPRGPPPRKSVTLGRGGSGPDGAVVRGTKALTLSKPLPYATSGSRRDAPGSQPVAHVGDDRERAPPRLLVIDLRCDQDLVRIGLSHQLGESLLDDGGRSHDRIAQRVVDAGQLDRQREGGQVVDRRLQQPGRAAAQADEGLLKRGEEPSCLRVCVGRDDRDRDDCVWRGQLRRGPEAGAIERERRPERVRGEMRGEGERQAQQAGEFGGEGRGSEQIERHLKACARHGAQRLTLLRLAEQILQLLDVARKAFGGIRPAPQRPQRMAITARRAAQAEVDAAGIERGQSAELLGDHERRMVRQHDAAGPDADRRGGACDVADHDGCGRGCDARHVVVLGEPEALKAECFGVACQRDRMEERLSRRLAGKHRR